MTEEEFLKKHGRRPIKHYRIAYTLPKYGIFGSADVEFGGTLTPEILPLVKRKLREIVREKFLPEDQYKLDDTPDNPLVDIGIYAYEWR